MDERRIDPRLPVALPCQCKWDGKTLLAHTVNLSMAGACVAHPGTVPPHGVVVELCFVATDEYHLRGRVAYNIEEQESVGGQPRFGMEFEGTPDHAKYCMFVAQRM